MREKTSISSPSSRRPSSRGAARLFCPAELPGVSLALAEKSVAVQPRHVHDSLTLGLVTAGSRRIETTAASAVLGPGRAFALPPGLAHACSPEGGPCSYIAFSIEPEALPDELRTARALLPLILDSEPFAGLLRQLAEAVAESADPLERQSSLAELLTRLAGYTGPAPRARDEALAEAVEQARLLLGSDLGAPLSLPQLAEACGAAPLALHRAFTRCMGLPPHAYRTHLRLRRAKALLRAGKSPAEAAQEAGFCDQSHLNRHFARIVGLTPAQYARAHAQRE